MMYCNDDRTPGESCFMSRMNAPWTNPEPLGEALPEFLRSPMTLAMGASVLAHGIFFLGLPVVANQGEAQDIRPVNVVQLTPQDQAQVPAIALQPQQPSSLIPSLRAPNPLSPNGPPNGLLTPPIPVSPNPSPNSTPFDFSGLSGGSMSQPSYSFPLDNSDNSYLQNRIRVAEAREAEARSALERSKAAAKPSPTPSPSASPSPTPSVTPTALPSVNPSVASSSPPPTNSPTNPPGSQTTPTPPSSQPPIVAVAVNPFHVKKAQEIPNGLVYNPESTQPVSLQGTSDQWYSAKVLNNPRLQRQGNIDVMASPFATQLGAIVTLKSPRKTEEIASYDPKQPILIGFVTDPNGQILDETIGVARSSGYPELNAIALGEVKDRLRRTKFPSTASKKPAIYTIGVTFVP